MTVVTRFPAAWIIHQHCYEDGHLYTDRITDKNTIVNAMPGLDTTVTGFNPQYEQDISSLLNRNNLKRQRNHYLVATQTMMLIFCSY